jgi:hypothetical protein
MPGYQRTAVARTENPGRSARPRSVRSCLHGSIAEELLQVMAGDESASADFDVGQVAATHLVVKQVAGQAGQSGGFIDGVGQSSGWLWFCLARLPRRRAARGLIWGVGQKATPFSVPVELVR